MKGVVIYTDACSLTFALYTKGADSIWGRGGNDDIYGGHNLEFGHDAGDIIDGGSDEDVILGDNGRIVREREGYNSSFPWFTGMIWLTYVSPFDNEVQRVDVRRYDDIDYIQVRRVCILQIAFDTKCLTLIMPWLHRATTTSKVVMEMISFMVSGAMTVGTRMLLKNSYENARLTHLFKIFAVIDGGNGEDGKYHLFRNAVLLKTESES